LEVSGESYTYSREDVDKWQISSMATQVDAAGQVDTQTALRQPMAALRSCAAQLPFPEQILPEAFEDHQDKLCVPRQLAALLGRPMQAIVDIISSLKEGSEWMALGLSVEDLRQFAVSEGHPFFFCSSNRLLLAYDPPQKLGKAIACALHDGHCYMYRSARCLANWHVRESVSTDRSKLQQEVKSTLPPLSEWEPWDERPRKGHFWCEDLGAVRQWFLRSDRNPRVTLKNMVDLSSLTYVCTARKDGTTGECKVRQLPQEASSIQHWLSNLPLEMEYRGEGLPAITQRVFCELLRAERRSPSFDARLYLCYLQHL
jgi:hypothetical protein